MDRRTSLSTALVLFLALTPPPPGRAEFLYFAKGGRVQAPATVEGDRVRVDTPVGSATFHTSDFLKIVPGGCPEREWPSRRAAALKGDASSRFAAAWWALENGLIPESVALLRQSHALAPSHRPTSRLVAMLDRLERPTDDPDTGPLLRALGVPCEPARSAHVLLLHQHDAADARARLDLLERVVVAYYLVLTGEGLELEVPPRRLVSVYLKDRQDYLDFLRSQNAGAFHATLGYFHPTYRAVIAYDVRTIGKSRASGGGAATRPVDSALDTPHVRDARRRHLLQDLDALACDHGTAAHELIHLLVTSSGLEPRPGAFPLWLHEGFAAQFEVVRGGRWAGVGRAHDLRLPDFRALSAPPALTDLVSDSGFGRGYRRDLYARCWSLVYFLRQTRPGLFVRFLDLLRLPESPQADPASSRFLTAFRDAFGPDLGQIETEWAALLRDVQTPLDENMARASPSDPASSPYPD